ncbi:uncharacterized protein LOC143569737 [Bidens hawaiensis]|uniref:uncharacterized protein LOC143569737 n=1 Tax=Bidens hawaiensis TaxID=980011 RepID=UPI004049C0C5
MDLKLRIIGTRQADVRTYNLPTISEVAALIVGDIGEAIDKRGIIVITQSEALKHISELHPSYLPLQDPIFYPYGDDGYRIDILHRELRVVYTIEFHKRGLPHARICLFLHSDHKVHNPKNIDKFISAEILDLNEDPELYSLVSDHMMHGPCGVANPKCLCIVDNSCSKKFPKKFQNETSIDSNEFPVYRRRDSGPDRATISLVQDKADNQDEAVDEVKAFYDCRYLSACEASWRMFSFDVHYRVPSVTRLPFHLPGQQTVVFADDDDVEDVLNKPTVGSSRFTAWMECNQKYSQARMLTYAEFPTKFVWKPDEQAQQKNLALLEIEYFLLRNNCTLRCFPTMPFLDDDSIVASTNRFMNEELAYDTKVMTGEFQRLFISLTDEQQDVYNQIMEEVDKKKGGIFLVYGYGGTGKNLFI